jgi:hypothetical protein
MYLGFNQMWNSSTDFHESPQYQISRKYVPLAPRWYMQTHWHMDGKTNSHFSPRERFDGDLMSPAKIKRT